MKKIFTNIYILKKEHQFQKLMGDQTNTTDQEKFATYNNKYNTWLKTDPKQFNQGLMKRWFEGNDFVMFYHQDNKFGSFSNFYPVQMSSKVISPDLENITVTTSEHLFQAAKFLDGNPNYAKSILQAATPGKTAQMGRNRNVPGFAVGWDQKSFYVMLNIVREKAKVCPEFKEELLSTGDKFLIENTTPSNDRIWGCGKDGWGKNWLGLVLMIVRDELK